MDITTVICLISVITFALVSVSLLVSNIQSLIEDRRRAKRDAEYHEARMKELNNK